MQVAKDGRYKLVDGLIDRTTGSVEADTHIMVVRLVMLADSSLVSRLEFEFEGDQFLPLRAQDERLGLDKQAKLAAEWSSLEWHCRERYASLPLARIAAQIATGRIDGVIDPNTVLPDTIFKDCCFNPAHAMDGNNANIENLNARNKRDAEHGDSIATLSSKASLREGLGSQKQQHHTFRHQDARAELDQALAPAESPRYHGLTLFHCERTHTLALTCDGPMGDAHPATANAWDSSKGR